MELFPILNVKWKDVEGKVFTECRWCEFQQFLFKYTRNIDVLNNF